MAAGHIRRTMIDVFRKADGASRTRSPWARAALLLLVVAVLGLPVDRLSAYALLLIAAVLIFTGDVILGARRWLAALAAAAMAIALSSVLLPPPIAQGVNIFLPGKPGNVFERALPGDVYRFMRAEFDAAYPPAVRCAPTQYGCWRASALPAHLYAFSADGAWRATAASRNVYTIDFADPVWLRLGFVNDNRYNWSTDAPDVHRADRNKPFWMGLKRWRLTMPWFVMHRFPAADVGARLCWRGAVLWPVADGHYQAIRHGASACRVIAASDVGRPIFGVAIRPHSLAMQLQPPIVVTARLAASAGVVLLGVIAVLALLLRVQLRDTVRPLLLIGLALVVIAAIDASFIGGWRPMDGGDDGLFYTGTGRAILQHLLQRRYRRRAAPAGRRSIITAVRACAISARWKCSSSATPISAICRWCCCCRSWCSACSSASSPIALPGSWRSPSRRCRPARSSAPASFITPNGRRAASPIRRRISCCSGACG